jgi:hypothetical protein
VFGHGVIAFERWLPEHVVEAFELVSLDPSSPANLRLGVEAFLRRARLEFSERDLLSATSSRYGYTVALTRSTYPGVDFQVTTFDERMTPTGHRDYGDFDEAAMEIWSALSRDERRKTIRAAAGIEGA